MKQKRPFTVTGVLLAIYLIILTWIIVFKMQFNVPFWESTGYRNINFIPFRGSLIVNGRIQLSEIIMNILVFVPFGVYLSMIKQEWTFWKKTAPIFGTSLLFETLQYIFAIGASDITDLLGNTLGGIIGIILFGLLSKVLKDNTIKIINLLAGAGTILVILFLSVVILANI